MRKGLYVMSVFWLLSLFSTETNMLILEQPTPSISYYENGESILECLKQQEEYQQYDGIGISILEGDTVVYSSYFTN